MVNIKDIGKVKYIDRNEDRVGLCSSTSETREEERERIRELRFRRRFQIWDL